MRVKVVVGNWKMNGSLATNQALLDALISALRPLSGAKFAVCSPYPYLAQVQKLLQGSSIGWGAQDVAPFASGAYTGEVSAAMLSEFGCRYVIVGHSERRTLFADVDEVVAQKYAMAVRHGLTPILCVGETLAQREAGATESVVGAQLDAVMAHAGVGSFESTVVAYEPVWAIGTGKTATPDEAQGVHAYLRSRIGTKSASIAAALPIIYGGSVKAANAAELFAMPDIDGALVGGASLLADEFLAICAAASAAARSEK